MIDEPIRWSHAYGKPVVPSSWQMTVTARRSFANTMQVLPIPWEQKCSTSLLTTLGRIRVMVIGMGEPKS